uniref:Mitochondrial 2-oxodicarboxylate carrier n=1 Tax=Macrostomum lignano TaxID=282301 RepID=A0A1I8FPS0_9PLAT
MASEKKLPSAATMAAINFASGGFAGFVEVCIMHPVDLVKTRYQVYPDTNASIVTCFRDMYRAEGFLSYYKGILPPLLAETPKRAVKFFTFEEYKRLFKALPISSALVYSGAGFMSGFTEAFVINPFERVKVLLQSQKQQYALQDSTWSTVRKIVRTDGLGLRGLNLGLTATIGRHARPRKPARCPADWTFARKFLIGFSAGTLASCINIPFDVAKSRIQGPQGKTKYRACFQTIGLVYREEGWRALYRGLIPKIIRLGPGGAIMLLVFEYTSAYLTSRIM